MEPSLEMPLPAEMKPASVQSVENRSSCLPVFDAMPFCHSGDDSKGAHDGRRSYYGELIVPVMIDANRAGVVEIDKHC